MSVRKKAEPEGPVSNREDKTMAEILPELRAEPPDYSRIVTEDDTPVDNIFSEKQQRLLTESLNSSWNPGHPFVAAADVGIFYDLNEPPVVPDMFVSICVQVADDMWEKKNRSYFLSEFGKPPDIAVEVVSNTEGGESGRKIRIYARAGVRYYIIFDPQRLIQKDALRVYELHGGQYLPKVGGRLTHAGLGVTVWEGVFEKKHSFWLRWLDHQGNLIPTGRELAELERKHTEEIKKQLISERRRADRLAEKLRELGIPFE